jgi:hypothetical protein
MKDTFDPTQIPAGAVAGLKTYVMKLFRLLPGIFTFFLLIAATPRDACINTESMIRFVEDQTEQALEEEELNLIRFHTYKALNAIERTRNQLHSCGCDYARKNLLESLEKLKLASRVTTLEGTRIPLSRAMEYIKAAKEALRLHDEMHERPFGQELMVSDTGMPSQTQAKRLIEEEKALEAKIEEALINYENSLQDVVEGVPCQEAVVFVQRVYAHSQKQLESSDLTPARKYYNLRTKEITENALERLSGCR